MRSSRSPAEAGHYELYHYRFVMGLALFTLAAFGCSRSPEALTAGGQPVSHWLEEAKKPDPKARKRAVKELGRVGKADPAAIPVVIAALKDAHPGVRQEAALALLNLAADAPEAADALTEAAHDKDPKVREYATEALARIRGER